MLRAGSVCLSILLALLGGAVPVVAMAADLLPDGVGKILKRHGMKTTQVGIYLAWADGRPVAMLNLDRPFNPASAAKLVTSMVALDLLGPSHTWESRLLAAAPVVDGSLRGDLYFQGAGDPFMTNGRLLHLVAGLHRRGVTHVAGDIVVDDSLFDLPPHNPAAFDGKGTSLYNAAPGAAVVNFGASQVHVRTVNGGTTVFLDPPSTTFTVTNNLRLQKSRCSGNWRARLRERLSRTANGAATLELNGRFPTGCVERSFFLLGQSDPVAHAAGAVGGYFELLGGSVTGGWRREKTPRNAKPISVVESLTLAEVLRGMNKNSNNFMARNIFLGLAAKVGKPPYTTALARVAVGKWFTKQGIDTKDLFIDNGSGLSRTTRITPRQFGESLSRFNRTPLRHELLASLAVLGRDGTARKWNKRSKSAGAAHIKTGTLSNARSTAGVVHNPAGDLVFVFLSETRSVGLARRAIQELLDWAYRLPPAPAG